MTSAESIIKFLYQKYAPISVLLYGSYANETNGESSDLDALLICNEKPCAHDGDTVLGVPLDVFLYTREEIEEADDMSEFVQVHDAKILYDTDEIGKTLKENVGKYIAGQGAVSEEEKIHMAQWCVKMLARAGRRDAEGYYRLHWLLQDSLEIYCNLRDLYYFGPKKTIAYLEKNDADGYYIFCKAMRTSRAGEWISYCIAPMKGKI